MSIENAVSWFEIPVSDIVRAKRFYEKMLAVTLQDLEVGEELKMALFPFGNDTVGGALCRHKDFYHPGHEGPLVYLNANPDLQESLDRVEELEGKILVPKRQISEEHGFMAVIEDTEGNRIALHSDR